jgi:hypothetical protein
VSLQPNGEVPANRMKKKSDNVQQALIVKAGVIIAVGQDFEIDRWERAFLPIEK